MLKCFHKHDFLSVRNGKRGRFRKCIAYKPCKMMGALPAAEVLTDITLKENYDQELKLGVNYE